MKLYITRHGKTEWNEEDRMQGWKDSKLCDSGIENAKRLGESLKNIDFDYIYSSSLGRAVETTKLIRGDKNTEILLVDDLKEINLGLWEGMKHDDIKELYPEEQFNFWSRPHLYKPFEGESFEVVVERVKRVLEDIIENKKGENVLIVTHTVVIKAIYLIVNNYSLEEFWKSPFIYDTCLTILEVDDKGHRLILEADISHLG